MNAYPKVIPESTPGVPELIVLHRALATAYGDAVVIALAGGAARDAAHSVEPRDLDYVLVSQDNNLACNAAEFCGTVLGQLGWDFIAKHEWYHDGIDTRLRLVVKLEKHVAHDFSLPPDAQPAPMCIDLLVYAEEMDTVDKVLANHDHSISQYAVEFINERALLRYTGETPEGQCYKLRDSHTSWQRIQYIKEKCLELGWTYMEEAEDAN